MTNRQWIYARPPSSSVTADTFELQTSPMPQPGPDQALVRVSLLSIDPAARAWMQGRTYREQLAPAK